MHSPVRPLQTKASRWIEFLFMLTTVVVLIILAAPSVKQFLLKAPKGVKTLSDGLILYKAMANYASDLKGGDFPIQREFDDPSTRVQTSNQAFEILLQDGMLDDKKVCFNMHSAWCRPLPQNEQTVRQILPGENDWCYVGGLNRHTMNHRWPILANAFAPGSTSYVEDQGQKGGVWKGTRALVIWAGGNGELVDTKEQDGRYFIRRPGQAEANAFERDGEWLAGKKVEILYPAP